jgi:hypothetical protein
MGPRSATVHRRLFVGLSVLGGATSHTVASVPAPIGARTAAQLTVTRRARTHTPKGCHGTRHFARFRAKPYVSARWADF